MSRNRCLLIAVVVGVLVALALLALLPGRAPAVEPGVVLAGEADGARTHTSKPSP